MLRTRASELFGIKHPVFLGGMATGTSPELVAAVSNAGGLGILGCSGRSPQNITQAAEAVRRLTSLPFGMNLLLFTASEEAIAATLAVKPPLFSTAWAFPDQDLRSLFARAHQSGAKVMHMVSSAPESLRAVEAGADIIVAQGAEGGGHVGVMGTLPLVPMVAQAVSPVPTLAAGGIADGSGLAASLMLGAEGALLGTRFLASYEAPLPESYKQAIVESDGHNTLLTEIPDIITGLVWPGAYARTTRNCLIEDWIGREGELRYRQQEILQRVSQAREAGDTENGILMIGETAGLIDSVQSAGTIVERIVADAETILRQRVASILQDE